MGSNSFANFLNCKSSNILFKLDLSGVVTSNSSAFTSIGTFLSKMSSFLLFSARRKFFLRLSSTFLFLILSLEAITSSKKPNSLRSSFAVFSPIPGTPAILSTESPISASRSGIFSGGTPSFSLTFIRIK